MLSCFCTSFYFSFLQETVEVERFKEGNPMGGEGKALIVTAVYKYIYIYNDGFSYTIENHSSIDGYLYTYIYTREDHKGYA